MASVQKRVKQSSRAKINRMVADGTRNYPSYLKLIYTGDSEFSSEDEVSPARRAQWNRKPSLPLHPQTPNQSTLNSSFDCSSVNNDCISVNNDCISVNKDCSSVNNDCSSVNNECSSVNKDCSSHNNVYKSQTCSNGTSNLPSILPKETNVLPITESLISPESFKLKDDGKEKAATPVTKLPPLKQSDLFNQHHISMSGSWHAFYNDKVVLSEDNPLEKLQLERELLLIQDEIMSIRRVLDTKVALATELKKRLGVGAVSDFKQGLANIKHSETFQKTNAALKSLSGFASRTITSLKSSRSFFKTPQLENVNRIKQSMSMADMILTKTNLKCSRSANNVCLP